MSVRIGVTQLALVEGCVADQDTDAVVTAAHWNLHGGQGTDGAVHAKAGPKLLEECRTIGWCAPGDAVITGGYELKARHVIHAVGPIWEKGKANEATWLRSAYERSLALAVLHGDRSISVPSISTGAFGYPLRLAAPVAIDAIVDFLQAQAPLDLVRIVLYPREQPTAYAIYAAALAQRIDDP